MTIIGLAILTAVVALFMPFDWWQKRPSRRPNTVVGRWLGRIADVSPRNIAIRACFLTVLLLLALLTLPAFLVLLLPLLAIAYLAYDIYGRLFRRNFQPDIPLAGVLLIVAMVWITTLGMAAPVRISFIAAYFLSGRPAGGELEGFAATEPEFAGFNLVVGCAGLAVALFWLARDALWRIRQASQVENLPAAKSRSVALGLVELRGVARSADDGAGPIVRLHWDMFDYTPKQELRPFYLEDETGRVLVDPTDCRVRAGWVSDLGSVFGCHEIVLQGRVEKDDRWDAVTRTLMPGDPVYLIGNAEVNPKAPPSATDSDCLVIRPSSQSSLSLSLWQFLFGKADAVRGESIFNVFFLADRDEVSAKRLILNGFYTVCGLALIWLACSVTLLWLAAHPVSPPPDSWRNAYWRGPQPNPDPSVLDMTRNERLFRFEKYIKDIGPQSTHAIPALIEASQYQDRRFRVPAVNALGRVLPRARNEAQAAIPVLVDIVDNGRFDDRQAAILTLGKLGPLAKEAVPSLVERLKEADDIIRYQAVRALGKIGPAARDAVPGLNALLQDPSLGGIEGDVPEDATFGKGIPLRKRTHQAVRQALRDIENRH